MCSSYDDYSDKNITVQIPATAKGGHIYLNVIKYKEHKIIISYWPISSPLVSRFGLWCVVQHNLVAYVITPCKLRQFNYNDVDL